MGKRSLIANVVFAQGVDHYIAVVLYVADV
jgi:hypothetical protein